MKAEFRSTTPADAPAIAAFLARIFDARPGEPILDRAMMQWKYWQPRPDWPDSRSFILERNGSIIAHGAAWPMRILTGSAAIPCFFLIDWAASPEFPGSGVSIMKHLSERVPVNFLYGGTEVARKMRFAMGYRPRNDVVTLALPIRPVRQILTSRRWNWKAPARLARNLAWSRRAPHPSGTLQCRPIDPAEIHKTGLVWPAPDPRSLVVERNPALFEYAAACPAVPAQFFLALRDSQPLGYFCLMFPPGQARIADACIASSNAVTSTNSDDWTQLYALAVDQARRRSGVNEVVAGASGETGRGALEACGFHIRARDPIQLYDPRKLVPPDLPLDAQLIDGDAAFRFSSGADYFT